MSEASETSAPDDAHAQGKPGEPEGAPDVRDENVSLFEPTAAEATHPEPASAEAPAADEAVSETAVLVEAIEPSHGPQTLGCAVVVRGRGFSAGARVRLGEIVLEPANASGEEAADVEPGAPGEDASTGARVLRASAPAAGAPGFVDVVIEHAGEARARLVNGFHWDAPPSVRGAIPRVLPAAGGARLVLDGDGLSNGCRVLIAGIESACTPDAAGGLSVVSPPHAPGLVSVEVVAQDGQRTAIPDLLRFEEGPVIESVSPREGPEEGGTLVELRGRGFEEGCTVSFFGEHAAAVERSGDGLLRFRTPRGMADRTGAVRVTNPGGLSAAIQDAFTYHRAPPPRIDRVTPERAWTSGGLRLTVSGAGFMPGVRATLGGVPATVVLEGDGTLGVIVPPCDAPGPVDLTIERPDGQSATLGGALRYEPPPAPPKLISIQPAQVFLRGGSVEVTGDNFDERTRMRVGEVEATVELVSGKLLSAHLPPRATAGKVAAELIGGGGIVVRFEEVLEYVARPAPTIVGIGPSAGPMAGGTRVSIEGSELTRDCTVFFGDQPAKSLAWKGPTQLDAVAPPAKTPGVVDILIKSPDAPAVTRKNAFRYEVPPAPVIESVSPNRGGTRGGTELSIQGKNFMRESLVLVGGKPIERVKLVDATLLEVRMPPGKNGDMVDVVVRNPGAREALARRAFLYDERYD